MAPRNLLDLPQETIDHILSFVVPHTPIESVRPLQHQLCHLSPDSWHQDALSLRLTCRYLSDIVAPSLFHDIYLYPMDFSFDRLEQLSKSLSLKNAVKRIIFMRPQFEERLRGRREYQQAREAGLQKEFAKCFRAIVGSPGAEHETLLMHLSDLAGSFLPSHMPGPVVDEVLPLLLKPGHDAYLKGLDEQKKLLDSNQYVYQGALLINKFPKLTSFVLSGGDGVKEGINRQHTALQKSEQPKSSQPKNFLETRYPLVRLDRQSHSSWPLAAEQAFVDAVMQMLSHVEVPITELSFPTELGVCLKVEESKLFFWNSLPLQNLKRLELYVDFKKSGSPAHAVIDIDTFLGTALARAKASLESFSLRTDSIDPEVEESPELQAGSIFDNIWPQLKDITLAGVAVTAPSMDEFLKDNTSIKNFDMEDVFIPQNVWRRIFTRIRGRKSAWLEARKCYCAEPIDRDGTITGFEFTVSTRESGEAQATRCEVNHVGGGPQCEVELEEFLAGQGEWTYDLKAYFGVLDADS